MNLNPYKISENFVLKKLKTINSGKLIAEDTVSNLKASTNKSKLEDVFLELTGRKLDD